MPTSDGTPKIPNGSGGKSEEMGEGAYFDLMSDADFLQNKWEDNFVGDAILGEYPAAKTNGASAAVTFTGGNDQGFLELVTGTDNNGYAGQAMSDVMHTGDRGLLAEFLVETPSSLASYKLEIGVADSVVAAGMVNSKSGLTSTGTDYAVLVFDTAHNSAVDLIHAKAGVTVRVTGDLTLAVSTLYYVTFRVEDDNVKVTIRGLTGTGSAEFTYANAVAAAGIEGGTDITPWVFTQARAGSASKTTRLYKWKAKWPAY